MTLVSTTRASSAGFVILVISLSLSREEDQANFDLVYKIPNLIPVRVSSHNLATGEDTFMDFKVEDKILEHFNTTKEMIEKGYIEQKSDGSTSEIVVPGGLRIPVDVKTDEVMKIHNKKGKVMFKMSKQGWMARTMKDLKGDETLHPLKPKPLLWDQILPCNLSSITILLTSSSVELISQNSIVIVKKLLGDKSSSLWWSGQGILLTAINPSTCDVTLSDVFLTGDFGYFRDLKWALDTIANGRIIVVSSLRDGSPLLGDARDMMSQMGSSWATHYAFRDGWVIIFVKGGKILAEALTPNLKGLVVSGSSSTTHISLPVPSNGDYYTCYDSWPTYPEWIARRKFCTEHDGYGSLCDCLNPFVMGGTIVIYRGGEKKTRRHAHEIPMIIMAGNRTRHLFRLLESVGNQRGVQKENFLIAADGFHEKTEKLTFILGLKTLVHRSEGITGKAKIGNNLRFSLYNAHKMFTHAKYFIVLEEDLILAPDFYAYMLYLAPMFEIDSSIYCVSAYNHLSFPHTSSDPSKVYRVRTVPSLGWMISRKTLEYVVPKMLPQVIDVDWDYFLGSEAVHGKREVLIPEINRSYHSGTQGLHVKGSLFAELMYLSRTMNTETSVTLVSLDRLTKDNYEREFVELISNAVYVTLDENGNFSKTFYYNHTYVTFVRKMKGEDDDSFRLVGDLLGIWNGDSRDHHNHAWRIPYRNATLFVVGVPISPYTKYLPPNGTYLSAPSSTPEDIPDNYKSIYSSIAIPSHVNSQNLPKFYYNL